MFIPPPTFDDGLLFANNKPGSKRKSGFLFKLDSIVHGRI